MKTSILICATCFIVTGCSAQLRFPSLSSALSSLTGFGGGSSSSGGSSSNGQSGQSSSPYSGLVRDYGRNLMMAMSSIYPTLFKPPQQSQPQQVNPPASQSPYDQAFGASQYGSQNLFPSQSAPSFSFGGSTFSISPSLPFGSLTGGGGGGGVGGASQSQAPSGSHSPFSASFGSSINSPSSFGPLSSAPFLQNSMPSFAPASSYNAAFESANSGPLGGGPNNGGPSGSFGGALGGGPSSGMHSQGGPSPSAASLSNQALMPQSSNSNPINSYSPIQAYNGQHDSSASQININQQHQPQPQGGPMNQQSNLGAHSSAGPFGSQQHNQAGNQYASQQYRPDMMSIAASSSVPTSNSYSNYGNIPSGPSSQQAPASPSSYQQPSYR